MIDHNRQGWSSQVKKHAFPKYPYLFEEAIVHMSEFRRRLFDPAFILRSLAVVTVLAAVISVFTWGISSDHSWENYLINFFFNVTLTLCLSLGSWLVADSVNLSWVDQPFRHFLVTAFWTLVLVIFTTLLSRVVTFWACCDVSPVAAIRSTQLGDFLSIFLVTALISTFVHGREFLRQWKASILEAEQIKQAYVASEYELLRQQVNPHFLFNSLNVLHTLVYQDADKSARFIRQLSKVYRYVLEGNREEIVSLEKELDILDAYLSLLATRFGESLQVNRLINRDDLQKGVIPLSLQMLVENVVKHNDIQERKPLTVDIRCEKGMLWVCNERREVVAKRGTTGLGLQNIRDRYQHLSGKDIDIQAKADRFCVGLPLIPLHHEGHIDRG